MLAMANLTSVSGDWLMWYADHDDPTHKPDVIAVFAPLSQGGPEVRCVGGFRSRAGASAAVLRRRSCGRCIVDELIHGSTTDRLNKSAEEALAKWEFYPASRNGQPVSVDVVVEIPFTLDDPATSHLRR